MKLNIDYIIAERARRERERRELENEEGRRLPLYIDERKNYEPEPVGEKYRFD
jgi:hypothetical protein